MFAFPAPAEFQCFKGDAIAQVWLDPNGVRFRFDSMKDIYAEHRIEHTEPDGTVWGYDCNAAEGRPLILQRLLYRRIIGVDREDLRVTFKFEDGSSLSIFSELGPHESGQITSPDGAILVF